MRLAAGIVNYRSYDDTLRCIEKLRQSALRVDRILVADNAGTPEGVARLRAVLPPQDLLDSPVNRGYAGGANAVLHAVPDADYVLIMNPDVEVTPGFFGVLIQAAEEVPQAAALTGKLLRPGGEIIDSAGVVARRNGRSQDRGAGCANDGVYAAREEVFGACGAAILLRRKALDELCMGGEYFDEDFFLYHEDNDLCWRARLLGWKILYVPAAVAYHSRGYKEGQRRSVSRVVRHHAFKNHYLKLTKNLLPGQLWRDGFFLATWELVRFGYALLREPFLLGAYAEALSLLPRALRKRHWIMRRRRAAYRDMAPWFV